MQLGRTPKQGRHSIAYGVALSNIISAKNDGD
ncbi:MAG: hypothetical protein BWZ08_02151 [candidate division BRC1 bacterium ADurb.BinA292]|nr:MAG: hypothetical protein BWZ08_02151 [candidate division BRC1 bacterium ADurb.BinA292]